MSMLGKYWEYPEVSTQASLTGSRTTACIIRKALEAYLDSRIAGLEGSPNVTFVQPFHLTDKKSDGQELPSW